MHTELKKPLPKPSCLNFAHRRRNGITIVLTSRAMTTSQNNYCQRITEHLTEERSHILSSTPAVSILDWVKKCFIFMILFLKLHLTNHKVLECYANSWWHFHQISRGIKRPYKKKGGDALWCQATTDKRTKT